MKIVRSVLVSLLLVTGTLAGASTAEAATAPESVAAAPAAPAAAAAANCPLHWYCFYIRVNYYHPSGQVRWRAKFETTYFGRFSEWPAAEGPTGTFQDNVESISNQTLDRQICLYNNNHLIGHVPPIEHPNSQIPNLRAASNIADYWRVIQVTSTCPAS